MKQIKYINDPDEVMYVLRNLRDMDIIEIERTLDAPYDANAMFSAIYANTEVHNYVALINEEPVALFGLIEKRYSVPVGWCLGTDLFERAVAIVTRHVKRVILPDLKKRHIRHVVCVALTSRQDVGRWIRVFGGKPRSEFLGIDPQGEELTSWHWVDDERSSPDTNTVH